MTKKRWCPNEDAYLLNHYQSTSYYEIAKHLNRPTGGIKARLARLHVDPKTIPHHARPWNPKNDNQLRQQSPTHSITFLKTEFNCTEKTIRDRQKELGIYVKTPNAMAWSQNEMAYLMQFHDKLFVHQLSQILNRSEKSVRAKLNKMELPAKKQPRRKRNRSATKLIYRSWTVSELNWLTENYQTATWDEMTTHLNRNRSSISGTAAKHNLTRKKPKYNWPTDEQYFVRNHLGLSSEEMSHHIPHSPREIQKYRKYKHLESHTWTPEQHQYLMDHYQDMSINQLANKLKKTYSSIYGHLRNTLNKRT